MNTVLLIREVNGQRTIISEYDMDTADKVALPADAELIQQATIDRLYATSGLTEPQLLAMLGLVDAREPQ
ncbi:MAG: hypothetical protein KDE20_07555 [Caldilineaceae bacterium]|nr:hypothetical protein [Caldilineaceae bacterium]